ncbi:MAG: SAM-dependent methyltransferase, partial [bacterium]
MQSQVGKVYLVGAGPGDPGLITVKGLTCIRTADVIIYDYLANPKLLAQAKPDAELIYVGKKGGD